LIVIVIVIVNEQTVLQRTDLRPSSRSLSKLAAEAAHEVDSSLLSLGELLSQDTKLRLEFNIAASKLGYITHI
jgi:hypothetical protein